MFASIWGEGCQVRSTDQEGFNFASPKPAEVGGTQAFRHWSTSDRERRCKTGGSAVKKYVSCVRRCDCICAYACYNPSPLIFFLFAQVMLCYRYIVRVVLQGVLLPHVQSFSESFNAHRRDNLQLLHSAADWSLELIAWIFPDNHIPELLA